MGLMHWHSHGKKGIFDIILGFILAALSLFFIFLYIRAIVNGDLEIFSIILIGMMLLFFTPFLLFGGINEIVETIDEYKARENTDDKK